MAKKDKSSRKIEETSLNKLFFVMGKIYGTNDMTTVFVDAPSEQEALVRAGGHHGLVDVTFIEK